MILNKGFTLLETVIAIGIILFGLLSIISLSTTSLIVSEVTSDEFLAANFAREGLELVRATRDSNWLAYDSDSTTAWNENLYQSGPDYSGIVSLRDFPTTGDYIQFLPNSFGDSCTGVGSATYDCTALWYDSTNNVYIQTSLSNFNPALPRYTQTSFSRLVYLYPICRNDSDETDEVVVTSGSCASGYTQVGIDAIVTVQWPGRSEAEATYSVEEHIYDWQY